MHKKAKDKNLLESSSSTKNEWYDLTQYDSKRDFQFNALSFNEWYKIVQYIINYDLIYTNLEYLDDLTFMLKQINLFLKNNGQIPEQFQSYLNELNIKYDELLKSKNIILADNEDELANDSNYNQHLLRFIKSKMDYEIDKIDGVSEDFKTELRLYFNNPFFLKNKHINFQERLKSLLLEKKIILKNIKTIKPYKKRYQRNLKLFIDQIKKIMNDPNFNFFKLFNFVRPYISKIISSDDYYYGKLVQKTILD